MSFTATGFDPALTVFDVCPEYAIQNGRARRGVTTTGREGVSYGRQTFTSQAEVGNKIQRRSWTLRWSMATLAEVTRIRELYELTGGGAEALLFYPPEETGTSNLAPSPENFVSQDWKRNTTDMGVGADGTALPAGVGGSAALVTNDAGSTSTARLSCRLGLWPGATTFVGGGFFVRRPASTPASYAQVGFLDDTNGTAHYSSVQWNGSTWVSDGVGSGDGLLVVDATADPWFRISHAAQAGLGGLVPQSPSKRSLFFDVGNAATSVEAGKDLLIAGAFFQEGTTAQALSETLTTYASSRTHVMAKMSRGALVTNQVSSEFFAVQVDLEEVIGGPR